jgi:biopolymer transport protein TolQ
MNNDLSLFRLIVDASLFAQFILGALLIASIWSWAIIIDKRRVINRALASAQDFETSFWSGVDLNSLYREMARSDATEQIIEGSRRAMRVSQLREMDRLEHNLALLATVSNTSPYVGLLGTVWGIMTSFQALGGVQSATIAMVAPGIADALVATAMGLIAAIPAGIFFNRYADQVGRLEVRYDTFMEELSAIFQRNAVRRDSPARSAGSVSGELAEIEP